MSAASRYAYLDTRVSLFAGRLLTDQDIERLIQDGAGEPTPPPGLDNEIGLDSEADLAGIDHAMMPQLLNELSVLLRSVSGNERDLLRYWANRFEIANLKTLIRGKMVGRKAQVLRSELADLGPFSRVPVDALLLSSDVAELLRQLEQTVYADIARDVRRSFDQQQDLFTIDASIDRHYFNGLARRARAVGQDARTLVGSVLDRVNLVWLLRYRFTYNLPPAQAYYLLIPASHRIDRERLLQLNQLEGMAPVLEALPPPFDDLLRGARSTSEVTRRLERHTWGVAERILLGRRFNPTRALAYMVLRERDLRRVRAIVRGRRLGMDPATIRVATGLDCYDGRPVQEAA